MTNGHSVPDLGTIGKKAKAGANVQAFVRKLDNNGLYEVDMKMAPNGQPQPALRRESYVDAEELVEMMRVMVREEIGRVRRKLDLSEHDD